MTRVANRLNYSGNRSFPAGNPIANALVIIVGVLAVGASVVLGFIAFVILACLLSIFAAVIGLRLWWFNRKLRNGQQRQTDFSRSAEDRSVIEGEYRVEDRSSLRD
jgi:hypothetical protein